MRVAIVGDYPLDGARIWGGVEAAFAYLVRELCQIEELELHVITMGDPSMTTRAGMGRGRAALHVLPPFPRFELARNFRTYQARLDRKLAEIQPDVVHAQGATDHAYAALRSRYPAVITVHGVQGEDSKYQGTLRRRVRKWLYSRLIERYNLRHTRHLIAIGRYVSDYFARQIGPRTKVYYVPNAIDDSFFGLDDCSSGATILYAGRVIPRKRPLDLVAAFARIAGRFPAARLRLAGEYSSELAYTTVVRDLIERAGLGERVQLLGGLSEAAVLREFAGCDLLALPSAQETTPMVIAQAMAAGKPVVATPVGGVPEMVSNGRSGILVGVGDVEGLAAALLRLLEEPQLRAGMGATGRAFALAHYQARSVARSTYTVYHAVATSA